MSTPPTAIVPPMASALVRNESRDMERASFRDSSTEPSRSTSWSVRCSGTSGPFGCRGRRDARRPPGCRCGQVMSACLAAEPAASSGHDGVPGSSLGVYRRETPRVRRTGAGSVPRPAGAAATASGRPPGGRAAGLAGMPQRPVEPALPPPCRCPLGRGQLGAADAVHAQRRGPRAARAEARRAAPGGGRRRADGRLSTGAAAAIDSAQEERALPHRQAAPRARREGSARKASATASAAASSSPSKRNARRYARAPCRS